MIYLDFKKGIKKSLHPLLHLYNKNGFNKLLAEEKKIRVKADR